ncbi:MAG: FeoA family protein [Planctomycetota bacterium]|nr:FeoA family protein [Planctomycetota bacterium]
MITNIDTPPVAEKPSPVPLTSMLAGEEARFCKADLRCEDCDLLRAMGLTDHCTLRICRGGEPCIIEVNSTRLALAAPLARRILVTPLGDHPQPTR